MKAEFQIIGHHTAMKLHSLGIRVKALTYYMILNKNQIKITKASFPLNGNTIAAYSIAELGELIPWGFFQSAIIHKMPGGYWQVKLINGQWASFQLEVECRAAYLIDLIEHKQLTIDEVNHPEKYNQPVKAEEKPVKKKKLPKLTT